MEFWLNVSMADIDHLVPIARAAEASGFAGLSLGDHLVFPQTIASPYPYSADGGVRWSAATHWPDAWVAIAAMAASTSSLRFTTGVYVAPLRDPFAVAKALSTASRLSGGRVSGGFGAGWMKEEFDLVGAAFEARGARMDEQIAIMRRLWTGEMVAFHGRFYDFPPVRMSPAPLEPIPLYIGGHNPAALRRAARNDGWIGVHRDFEETAALIAQVQALRREDPGCGRGMIMINVLRAPPEDIARFAALEVDALVLPALALPAEPGLDGRLDAIRRAGESLRGA
jgi:probable F420-dependent oxidoreductase